MAKINKRLMIQSIGVLAFNGNLKGFLNGKIYQGNLKKVCVPVLNCYACPGAVGSCPIGSMQAISNSQKFHLSFYVLGLLALFGILMGRFFCGYLCPFGLIQDLFDKIPLKKIRLGAKWKKIGNITRYLTTILLVFLLPMVLIDKFGMGNPLFCKYICPSGTFFGAIPLLITNPMLQGAIGLLTYWKFAILIIILIVSIVIYRPFCRFLCPLGAILGIFNPISLYRFKVEDSCIKCGKCEKACGLSIVPHETPNDTQCIRCDECIKACPVNAIKKEFSIKENEVKESKLLNK